MQIGNEFYLSANLNAKEIKPGLFAIEVKIFDFNLMALGYDYGARWVTFWWEPIGDELAFSDGRIEFVGANWWAWLELKKRNPILRALNFGSSDKRAYFVLLVDTLENEFYIILYQGRSAYLKNNEYLKGWPPCPCGCGKPSNECDLFKNFRIGKQND